VSARDKCATDLDRRCSAEVDRTEVDAQSAPHLDPQSPPRLHPKSPRPVCPRDTHVSTRVATFLISKNTEFEEGGYFVEIQKCERACTTGEELVYLSTSAAPIRTSLLGP
jgi:hypothetical protein